MVNLKEIEEKIEKWLSEEKIPYKKIEEEHTHFHFEIEFFDTPYHIFSSISNKKKIGVRVITETGSKYLKTLKKLPEESRFELCGELRFFFLNKALFDFDMEDNILTKYHLQKNIFSDGLTQDRLFSVIYDLHHTNLGAMWIIQHHLDIDEEPKRSDDLPYIG